MPPPPPSLWPPAQICPSPARMLAASTVCADVNSCPRGSAPNATHPHTPCVCPPPVNLGGLMVRLGLSESIPVGVDRTTRPVGVHRTIWPVGTYCATQPVGVHRTTRPVGVHRTIWPVGTYCATQPVGLHRTTRLTEVHPMTRS
eukprot:362553-Chlamydomonas_euryale.AAC.7